MKSVKRPKIIVMIIKILRKNVLARKAVQMIQMTVAVAVPMIQKTVAFQMIQKTVTKNLSSVTVKHLKDFVNRKLRNIKEVMIVIMEVVAALKILIKSFVLVII